MKGRIYSEEKCQKCGGKLKHDENRGGLFCQKHPNIRANSKFIVRFGREVSKRFNHSNEAIRFLIGLRYETDKGTFDVRDYRKDSPLSFGNIVSGFLKFKAKDEVRAKTVQSHANHLGKAVKIWKDRNIKSIKTADIQDFIFDDHLTPKGKPISGKTRYNLCSSLSTFYNWACERDESIKLPKFPTVKYKLGWRNITTIAKQQAIIAEVKRISYHINPKIWIGIIFLSTYINVRPDEMRNIEEKHINLESGYILIAEPKEGSEKSGKYVYLDEDDIELLRKIPKALNPEMFFFIHRPGRKGVQAGTQFGPKYFKTWWDRACSNLGYKKLGLYGGTKHSTATALGNELTPEQIKRGGTGSATNKAFERYFQPRKKERELVRASIKKLQSGIKNNIIKFPEMNKKV